MCGVVGNWWWGGNEDVHWADNCACTGYEPHSYDANGLCRCGRTGPPGGGDPGTPHTPCGMCGVVGPWRWGGNADLHWADNCDCTGNEPHSYDENGLCRCGRTGPPGGGDDDDGNYTPCGICGVVGPWRWGYNADRHWADNCNCTGNEPHSFDANGLCRCGATRVPDPRETFREENYIDTDALINDLRRAIAAGEVPTIDLTDAGSVTILGADALLAIARLGVDVVVILPSGFSFTIIASSIKEDVGAFDLNIDVIIKHNDAQLDTLGGGKVDVSANSLVFMPNFHGSFGFDLVFNVTADQIAEAGIDVGTVNVFHVDANGNVTDLGRPTVNDDGSVNFTISHASFYVLSTVSPVTAEIGTGVIINEIPGEANTGEEPVVNVPAPIGTIQQVIAEEIAANRTWFWIAISAAVALAAVSVTIGFLKRRHNTRQA